MNDELITTSLIYNFQMVLPEIVLVVFACFIFLGGTFRANKHLWAVVSLLALACSAVVIPLSHRDVTLNSFASPIVGDALGDFVRWLSLAGGMLLVLFSWSETGDEQAGDYFGCLMIIIAGLSLVGAANELVTLFIALEMISIPTYIMLYLPKNDNATQESAVKYFMLSIFSSAILLFGFSYLYGLAGSTNLSVILYTLRSSQDVTTIPLFAQVAVIMILAGLGFKIAAVPFHFYAPDVYEGTSAGMAALLAFVPKVAGFVALIRVLGFVIPSELFVQNKPIGMALSSQIPILLWFLAAITMLVGNVLALLQNNIKRMLAYSSVAHAGYMLIALSAAPYLRNVGAFAPDGIESILYYLAAYGAMTIGAFAVISYLDNDQRPMETVDDLAGLSKTHPGISLLMVIFLFSLIGMPFTAGFTGKLLIFFGAIGVNPTGNDTNVIVLFRVLAFIAAINAAIGGWYYLRLIAMMYLRTAIKPAQPKASLPILLTIVICAILTIGLALPPGAKWMLEAVSYGSGRNIAPVPQAELNGPAQALLDR